MDREKVIKELHDARRYLEDKEWSDRCASPHIDAINNALVMLKEQPQIVHCKDCKYQVDRGRKYKDCDQHFLQAKDNWFCADGVRKE